MRFGTRYLVAGYSWHHQVEFQEPKDGISSQLETLCSERAENWEGIDDDPRTSAKSTYECSSLVHVAINSK